MLATKLVQVKVCCDWRVVMCLTKKAAGRRADVIIRVALMSMHGMYLRHCTAAASAGTAGAADVVTNAHHHRLTIISFDISRANFFI